MRDPDIRRSLRQHLRAECGADASTLIIDEFGVCGGEVRADLVVINGEMKGYEIKSDFDSFYRLEKQAAFYGKVFDTSAVVIGRSHIRKIRKILPSWWGILAVADDLVGPIALERIRLEKKNLAVDPNALIQLLWRDEVLQVLRTRGLHQGLASRPEKFCGMPWSAIFP